MISILQNIKHKFHIRKDVLFGSNLRIYKIFVVDVCDLKTSDPMYHLLFPLIKERVRPTVDFLLESVTKFKVFVAISDVFVFVVFPLLLIFLGWSFLILTGPAIILNMFTNYFLEQKHAMPQFNRHKDGDVFSGIEEEEETVKGRLTEELELTKTYYPSKYQYFLVTDAKKGEGIDLQENREIQIAYKIL